MLRFKLFSNPESFFAHMFDHILPLKCFFLLGSQVTGNIKTYAFVNRERRLRNQGSLWTGVLIKVLERVYYVDEVQS